VRTAPRSAAETSAAVTLHETLVFAPDQPPDVVDVQEALTRLAEVDERKASVVELRYFGGMTREEIASALDLTVPHRQAGPAPGAGLDASVPHQSQSEAEYRSHISCPLAVSPAVYEGSGEGEFQ
jgi:hypothetical protein